MKPLKRLISPITLVVYALALHGITWSSELLAQSFKPEALRTSFLYHIAHYTNYPDNVIGFNHFNFCFLEAGERTHRNLFELLPKKQVKGKNIKLIRLNGENDEIINECQLVFVSKSAESPLVYDKLLQLNKTMVSVGETRSFVEKGGLITIVPLQSKMKIFFSKEEFENTRLKFSSLLLKRASFR